MVPHAGRTSESYGWNELVHAVGRQDCIKLGVKAAERLHRSLVLSLDLSRSLTSLIMLMAYLLASV